MSDETQRGTGLYPVLTRVPFSDRLLASPGEYDAAPAYLRGAFRDRGDEVRLEVARSTASAVSAGAIGGSLGRQLMIAVELAAPIGMGIVRSAALAKSLGAIVVHFNPVTALLAAPALFFTARKTLTDLRRALSTDPKVRGLIERAQAASDAGDLQRAERLLEEALEQDLDPAYRRNGDLYLQLGVVQMQAGRPRKAMISLAKASVLFTEADVIHLPREDGSKVAVSKRGWTEMLACAAIDSFARDEAGIDEWAEIIGDFAGSAEKRLETVARAKEAGHLFGLFGVDQASAALARELAAKARFLAAKVNVRRLASISDEGTADQLLDDAIVDLLAANGLDDEERFLALLEQAQFYTSVALGDSDLGVDHGARALKLMEAAAAQLDASNPARAAQTRAEAVAFCLELMPTLVARGKDVARLREGARALAESTGAALRGPAAKTSLARIGEAWTHDVRYQLAEDADMRVSAVEQSYAAYMRADEPVAAMYAALRRAYLAASPEEVEVWVGRLAEAARVLLAGDDPLSAAFAGKYLLAAMEVTGAEVEPDRFRATAHAFVRAADDVSLVGAPVPFTLHGKRVLHSASAADAILRQHAASLFAKAGASAECVALFERVRADVGLMASAAVQRRFELDLSEYLGHLGHCDRARELAEKAERDARGLGDPHLQRRALEILHALGRQPADDPVAPVPEVLARGATGWLAEYVELRDGLVAAGRRLVSALSSDAIRTHLVRSSDVTDALGKLDAELERIAAERFELGIVGEFSAGKSTFINALLGANVLPSSVRPTTSAPNRVYFGPVPAVRVHFTDGRTEHAELEALSSFVTERGNPGNARGVSHVEIAYPSPLLESGLELLDTPGLSSLVEAHEAVTREAVPRCDAVLVLAAARQPFTASLDLFLDGVGRLVASRTFYVLNKIDQIEPEQRETVVRFAAEQMHSKRPGVRVLAVSSYRALTARRLLEGTIEATDLIDDPRAGDERDPARLLEESRFPVLEAELGDFLSGQRGIPRLRDTAGRLRDLVHQIELALTTERRAAQTQGQERLETYQRLASELEVARAETQAALARLDSSLRSAVADAQARARTELVASIDTVLEEVAPTVADIESDSAREVLKQRIRTAIEGVGRAWIANAAERLTRELREGVAAAESSLRRHRRELRIGFGTALGLDLVAAGVDATGADLSLDVSDNRMGRLAVEVAIGVVGGLLLGVFGGFVAGTLGRAVTEFLFGGEDAMAEKLREGLRPLVARALAGLGEDVSASIERAGTRQIEVARAQVREQQRELLAEFQNRLAALLSERQRDENEERELTRLLNEVQTQAAAARRVVDQLLDGRR